MSNLEQLRTLAEELDKKDLELAKHDKYLRAIVEIQNILLANGGSVFPAALKKLGEVTHVSKAFVFTNLIYEGRIYASRQGMWRSEEITISAVEHFAYDEADLLYEKLSSNQIVHSVPSPGAEPWSSILANFELNSSLLIPLFIKEEYIGFVGISDYEDAEAWDKYELNLMRTVATGISFYLKNSRNEKKVASAINSMKGILETALTDPKLNCATCGVAKEILFAIKNTITG
jgi:hypothetical protein